MIKKQLMVKRIYNNQEVYYGKGATGACLKALDLSRLLVLVSGTVKRSDYYNKIMTGMAGKQIPEEIVAEPLQEEIAKLAQKYKGGSRPDIIVAIGGGKVLDSAKVLRVLLDNP